MRHLPIAAILAGLVFVMALPSWPKVVALLVGSAALLAHSWVELRREKIHDVDRQNLAALLVSVGKLEAKLNSVHGQVFAKRIADGI